MIITHKAHIQRVYNTFLAPSFDRPTTIVYIRNRNGINSKCARATLHNISTQDLQHEIISNQSFTSSRISE